MKKEKSAKRRLTAGAVLAAGLLALLSGCGSRTDSCRIVRIGHNQSVNHPTHLALTAFQEMIGERLGDRFRVEVYPSELLGSQTDMVQLTQTGAMDFCVASNAILETFSKDYELFNLPYLFQSTEAYHGAMEDEAVTGPVFSATRQAGFTAVAWLDAGTRNFYTVKKPVERPEDLRGLKIRVQQSPTNIEMMRLLGGSATPMGFGDVYTALQSGVIDGVRRAAETGAADEDARDVLSRGDHVARLPVSQLVAALAVDHMRYVGTSLTEVLRKSIQAFLARNVPSVDAHEQHFAARSRDLFHQTGGAGACPAGVLPDEAVPQTLVADVLVVDNDLHLLPRNLPETPVNLVGEDASNGESANASVQQPPERGEVALRIIGMCVFDQHLHAMLPCVNDAFVHALHDLLLEIRFAERDQNADLVFLS